MMKDLYLQCYYIELSCVTIETRSYYQQVCKYTVTLPPPEKQNILILRSRQWNLFSHINKLNKSENLYTKLHSI